MDRLAEQNGAETAETLRSSREHEALDVALIGAKDG